MGRSQRVLGGVRMDDNILLFGDLNAKVGNLPLKEVVRLFEVPSVNKNGERLVQMCAERDWI